MTRLPAKYLTTTDRCIRCSDRPTVAPDGLGPTTDASTIVLLFRCDLGHCWERSFRRADLNHGKAKATAAPRRHVATRAVTTTAPTTTGNGNGNADHEDEANLLSKAARQPSPKTGWLGACVPSLGAWVPRGGG